MSSTDLAVKSFEDIAGQSVNPMLIDTHCHLDDPSLLSRLPEVLAAAKAAGVEKYIVPGVAPDGWDGIARLAAEHAGSIPPSASTRCSPTGTTTRSLEQAPPVCCEGRLPSARSVSTTWSRTCRARQQQAAFRAQLRLAVETGLPVLIHCRRAFRDLLGILGRRGASGSAG